MSDRDRFDANLAAKAMRMGERAPRQPERRPQETTPVDLTRARAQLAEQALPELFRAARVADAPDVLRADLEAWVADPVRNLVLLGKVGHGKSHLAAAAVAAAYRRHGAPARFVWTTVAALMERSRPDGDDDGGPGLAVCRRAPVLVLDDLGAERATDWTTERLGLLVDQRWSAGLPIVVTANLAAGPDGPLMAHTGERTYSRLVGGALVARVEETDRRRNPQ